MPLSQNHNHEADEHYHGEPSRVLSDEPFPETAVLYPGTPKDGFFNSESPLREKDIAHWSKQLGEIPPIKRLFGPDEEITSDQNLEIQTTLNFGGENTGSFLAQELLSEPSLLFIPGRLRMDEGGWEDLKQNDVTVNWLSLDPEQLDAETNHAIVLSDWIVSLSGDVSNARSAGTTPGIFHLVGDQIENFAIALNKTSDPWRAMNQLLDEPDVKFRPGFIRDRSWEFT